MENLIIFNIVLSVIASPDALVGAKQSQVKIL